ncbi:Hypothetical cytosolic protein [Lactobacillus helveticus H10]|nr:Hypothetical cytosolic protein [Lactobacillus helveticus H10]
MKKPTNTPTSASQGVRHDFTGKSAMDLKFQSTHSQGVRQLYQTYMPSIQKFQSTHSQGVRLTE